MAPYLSVVIPVLNEEDIIPSLWARLSAVLHEHYPDRGWEVIFIDDGSRDRSLERLLVIAKIEPRVTIVEFNRNYGQQRALFGGFSAATGQVIVTLDADLQNPPEEIPRLVAKLEEGYDVAAGWRQGRMKNDSLLRTIPSKLVNALARRVTGVELHDFGCMQRAYRREIVEAMLQCKERACFIPALANTFAKRIAEIPVGHAERAAGDSKYGFKTLFRLQFDLLTGFSLLPLQLLSLLGALVSFIGIGFGAYLMVERMLHPGRPMEVMVFLLDALIVLVGAQFLAFGLLGEYIGRIYQEVRDRPRYVVKRIHKLA